MSGFDPLLILVRTGAVMAVALLVMTFARRSPALRVAAVRASFVAALVLVLGSYWWRERPQPVVSVPNPVPFTVSVPVSDAPISAKEILSKEGPATPAVMTERTIEVSDALSGIWLAGSSVLFLHLLAGMVAMARFRRGCRPIDSSALQQQIAILAAEAGVGVPAVMEGEAATGPFVSGVRRATVFLPKGWAMEAEPQVVEAVLRHELAHIANGDLRWGLFGRLVGIALWPQPLLWLLRKPLAAAEEEACDRQVVASGVSSASYAAGLLALRESRSSLRVPSLGIGAVSSQSGFSRRVEAILAFSGKSGVRLSKRGSLAVRSGALALAGGAAFVFARPQVLLAEQDDPTKGWIQKSYATKVRVLDEAGKTLDGATAYLLVYEGLTNGPAKALSVRGSEIQVPEVKANEDAQGILAVRVPGRALGFVHLWPSSERVREIRLSAPVALSGKLILPDGRPAAGLRVTPNFLIRRTEGAERSSFLPMDLLPNLLPKATTDGTGTFTLTGLPPNTGVAYGVDDDQFARLGFSERAQTGTSGTAKATPIRLILAGVVEGRVTRDGRPVAGLTIGAQENHEKVNMGGTEAGNAVTDADGRYRMARLRPTIYNLIPDLAGGLDQEVTAVAQEAVQVRAGERVTGKDFELIPGTVIEGVVTGGDGKPMPQVYVGVYGPAHPNSSAWVQGTRTDAQGRYRFRVPAGKQMVYISDGRYDAEQKHITTSGSEVTRVDFTVKPKPPSDLP